MQRLPVLVLIVLGGCLYNPTVEVDRDALDVPRGASTDVLVSIDGEPVYDLSGLYVTVDDPDIATVAPSYDGYHLRIGGNLEGNTVVHVSSYGQDIEISTRVGPPALVSVWTEPAAVKTSVGSLVEIRAKAVDTMAQLRDITFDSRWRMRDEAVASLDQAGMMLTAMGEGHTTLHVTHGANALVVPVSIYK